MGKLIINNIHYLTNLILKSCRLIEILSIMFKILKIFNIPNYLTKNGFNYEKAES